MMTALMTAMNLEATNAALPRMDERDFKNEGNQFAVGDSEDEDRT